ncbi:MAG TPA: hypothetical protein ENL38_03410 [Candidatus Aminicenantes bacterium]|nr:hypothetical protein [Candidatus Aminicenantes bacterium]
MDDYRASIGWRQREIFLILFFFLLTSPLFLYLEAQEIFIYRPYLEKKTVFPEKSLSIHGEIFGYLQYPSTFPSYNDLTGPEDRWTYGFQNFIFLTPSTTFLAQLITHDDGGRRTKFDWHFSLRQEIMENLVLIIGHDSNHDSDYQSLLNGHSFYINRNYLGLGLPFEKEGFYLEPFTWFFHHTNQRGHLDLSGEKLKQEYGLRLGALLSPKLTLNLQVIAQSEVYFAVGQAFLADVIFRYYLDDLVHLTLGLSFWKDIQATRWGNKKHFYKVIWGLAIPF